MLKNFEEDAGLKPIVIVAIPSSNPKDVNSNKTNDETRKRQTGHQSM